MIAGKQDGDLSRPGCYVRTARILNILAADKRRLKAIQRRPEVERLIQIVSMLQAYLAARRSGTLGDIGHWTDRHCLVIALGLRSELREAIPEFSDMNAIIVPGFRDAPRNHLAPSSFDAVALASFTGRF